MSSKIKDDDGFMSEEFLDTFGREFYKHEVLWKPNPNWKKFRIQSATNDAYKMMALALNLSVKTILELLETFPLACLDLMNRYDMLSRVNATWNAPDWLPPLVQHFRLLHNTKQDKNSTSIVSPTLVRSLCESAWARLRPPGGGAGGPAGAEDDILPLLDRRAVAHFAERHSVRDRLILPLWRGVYRLCVLKLQALSGAGDQPWALRAALRPSEHERGAADLALLHDQRLNQLDFLTPAKLRSLVLLLQLIVAATEIYDREKRQLSDDDEIEPPSGSTEDSDDRSVRRRTTDARNILIDSNTVFEERCGPRSDEVVTVPSPTVDASEEAPRPPRCDRVATPTTASTELYYTKEKLSNEVVNDAQNLLQNKVIKCEPMRDIDDSGVTNVEECSVDGLHTELDLKPDINVICSDSSDNEFINEQPTNNIGISILVHENRPKECDYNIIDKSDVRYPEKGSGFASKISQDFDIKIRDAKGNWYEEIKSSASEEQRVVWALVYTDFIKRGRSASLISLQHRWVELLHRARAALLAAWDLGIHCDRNVHPLLLAVGHRFPDIVTDYLPTWKTLVAERQILLECDIKDIIHKYQENDDILLNINENLGFGDLVEEYVINTDTEKSNATNKHLSYQIYNEIPNTLSIEKLLKLQPQAQDGAVNNCISNVLDRIDPSKAKVSIIFDEDSDEDLRDDNRSKITQAFNSDKEALRNQFDPIPDEKCNVFIENALKNIEKEFQDKLNYINNPVNPRSELRVRNNHIKLDKHINGVLNDKQTLSNDFESDGNILKPSEINVEEDEASNEYIPVIDEKLVQFPRVVITPYEHLPDWKKHSRNGVMKCRNFSVRNFTKPVIVNSKQLSKCRLYVNTKRDTFDIKDNCIRSEDISEKHESKNRTKSDVRIKFEDDNFETDFGVDDVNNGIKYQKYIELYSMPDHLRRNRINLTKKLKLPRTYFSLNFWSLDRNIELMKLCKPISVKLNKVLSRFEKPVHISDFNTVPMTSDSITTAPVSLGALKTAMPDVQRSCLLLETVNSINKSICSESITTRQTNNSISSALGSSEFLKLSTNYALETKKKTIIESETKNNTCSSKLTESVIETMRIAEGNKNQNSTVICTLNSLQQNPLPKSNLSELLEASSISKSPSAPDRPNNQESTEEERINNPLKSINIPLLNTTACNIHISSDFTKELYLKHVEKMKNNSSTSSNLAQTKMLNVSELKDMILLLTRNCNNKMRREYDEDMKTNRSNLNIYMKLFKKQHRFLVKYISKLNKILPEYVLNGEPKGKANKNVTPAKKTENVNLIAQEQTQEDHKLASDNTNNVLDFSNNRNSVFVDDDCEPKLVIDERSLEASDNDDFKNSEFNTISVNKNIGETLNKKKKDKKKHSSKKAKQKTKKSNEISHEEKPTLNEYQEWQRQKTMALKYFTIPLTDTNKVIAEDKTVLQLNDKMESKKKKTKRKLKKSKKISEEKPVLNEYQEWQRQKTMALKYFTIPMTDTSKVKTAPQLIKTRPTTKQSNGCQTLISIKRKNTEDLKTTSATDITKRLKLPSNENDVVCISDESDDDVQITECNIKKTSANRYKTNTPKLKREHVAVDQNVCVINTRVATISQPLYLIINGAQMPVVTQGDMNAQNTEAINNPLYQVLSNSTPFPTQTQSLVQEANYCHEASNSKCKCVKCQDNWRDKNLSCIMKSIQDVAFRDSTNNKPSISLLKRKNRPIKKAITVEEYLSDNKKLTTLIKVDGTQNVVFFCDKYIILTDVDISNDDATYRTTCKTKNYKSLLQVLVPNDSKSGVLHLGLKSESDYIHCKCVRGALVKCNLCHRIENNLPKATNFLKIDNEYYKKMCENPIKYVRLTKIELETNSPVVLEGNPDRIFVSEMHFKKLTDSPPTYIRILSSVPDATMLRLLVHQKILLYAFDVTQTQHYHTPLMYSLTAGQVTVDHSDNRLVRVLQWILN